MLERMTSADVLWQEEAGSLSRRSTMIIAVCLIAIISVSYAAYQLWRFDADREYWLKSDAYMVFEQSFVWNGISKTDYMVWNITRLRDGYADLRLMSHGANVTESGVELTLGEADLTIDLATRKVVNGSEMVGPYLGEKWPFWIETNVSMGSVIDTWYGVTSVSQTESIYVLGQRRDCWLAEYDWPSGSMKRWFDMSSGMLLKIHNVLYRHEFTIVVTETAVMTNVEF